MADPQTDMRNKIAKSKQYQEYMTFFEKELSNVLKDILKIKRDLKIELSKVRTEINELKTKVQNYYKEAEQLRTDLVNVHTAKEIGGNLALNGVFDKINELLPALNTDVTNEIKLESTDAIQIVRSISQLDAQIVVLNGVEKEFKAHQSKSLISIGKKEFTFMGSATLKTISSAIDRAHKIITEELASANVREKIDEKKKALSEKIVDLDNHLKALIFQAEENYFGITPIKTPIIPRL